MQSRVALSARRIVVLSAVGGVLGTLGDRIHTYFGVLTYPWTTAWGEPWWVLPLMASAGAALVGGHAVARGVPRAPTPGGTTGEVARAGAWFAASYAASGVLREHGLALTVAMSAAFVARAPWAGAEARATWTHAIGAAVAGTAFESALCAAGVFRYIVTDRIGYVPAWLPALYLQAALFAGALERRWPIMHARASGA
jgi:hypothetical protein